MEVCFNVPTVVRKCAKALGNIPVIRTFYRLMRLGGDGTQCLLGLANHTSKLSSAEARVLSRGSRVLLNS